MRVNSNTITRTNLTDKIYFTLVFFLGISISISTALTSVFAVALLLTFSLSGDYNSKLKLIKRFYIWPSLTFILLAFISCFYSSIPFTEALTWVGKFYKLLIVWVVAYVCYKNPQIINKLLLAFFIGVVFNVVAIFINYYFLNPENAIVFSGATFPAAQSHFVTGFIFAVAAFMLFSMALTCQNKKKRIFFIILGVIIICAELGLNTSRTGYLIEFSVLAIGFLMKFRWKGVLAAIVIVPSIFIAFYHFSPSFKMRVTEAYNSTINYYNGTETETSAGIRLGFYHTALGIFEHKPQRIFYGCGTGEQTQCSMHFINSEISQEDKKYYQVINNPHNQYIYFAIQSGIWALALFVWLLIAAFYYAKDLPIMMRNNTRIFIIAFAVGCLVNSWILDIGPGFIFSFLLPVLFAQRYQNKIQS
ncbi:O-antigen ligase family protein [Fastidiosibacter lacustris]|uniref:O-antigen ligase family protein n=1 Tax=Fastidiosibacter lacustris TaxID=2056695 RepID=UPI000E35240D|nr:O-antigen ligase family protein [Fastidiosibacter lacustris]